MVIPVPQQAKRSIEPAIIAVQQPARGFEGTPLPAADREGIDPLRRCNWLTSNRASSSSISADCRAILIADVERNDQMPIHPILYGDPPRLVAKLPVVGSKRLRIDGHPLVPIDRQSL